MMVSNYSIFRYLHICIIEDTIIRGRKAVHKKNIYDWLKSNLKFEKYR